jgi:hypothetical protein
MKPDESKLCGSDGESNHIVIFAGNRSLAQPPLYLVAHALKILGGLTGGLVAERRRHRVVGAEGS